MLMVIGHHLIQVYLRIKVNAKVTVEPSLILVWHDKHRKQDY